MSYFWQAVRVLGFIDAGRRRSVRYNTTAVFERTLECLSAAGLMYEFKWKLTRTNFKMQRKTMNDWNPREKVWKWVKAVWKTGSRWWKRFVNRINRQCIEPDVHPKQFQNSRDSACCRSDSELLDMFRGTGIHYSRWIMESPYKDRGVNLLCIVKRWTVAAETAATVTKSGWLPWLTAHLDKLWDEDETRRRMMEKVINCTDALSTEF